MSEYNLTTGKSVEEKLDRSSIKFNQGAIVVLVSIAFLLNLYWLVAFVSLVMLIGTLFPKAGLFKLTYFYFFRPLGIIKSHIVKESNTPHLFAQGMGGVVLAVAFLLLNFTDQNFIGWFLSLVVVALAFINLTTNFCAGCFIYYRLNKMGIFSSYSGKQRV
jgi:hypothetical protein